MIIRKRILGPTSDQCLQLFLEFLKSGRSKYPIETLKLAGVDMNTNQPVEKALKLMDNLLDQVDELL